MLCFNCCFLLLIRDFLNSLGFLYLYFSFAVCIARWHRLSDVIGSILLCTGIFVLLHFLSSEYLQVKMKFFSNLQPSGLGYKKLGTSVKISCFLVSYCFCAVFLSFIVCIFLIWMNIFWVLRILLICKKILCLWFL